jgi:hypothetical protein
MGYRSVMLQQAKRTIDCERRIILIQPLTRQEVMIDSWGLTRRIIIQCGTEEVPKNKNESQLYSFVGVGAKEPTRKVQN